MQHSPYPNRRTYAALALAYTAFTVYGSLVPLKVQPVLMDEALRQVRTMWLFPPDAVSGTDLVSNVLLFVPFGFLWMAVARVDRRGVLGALMAAASLTIAAGAIGTGIEFLQIFFPPRTTSLTDVAAQTGGALLGVAVSAAFGQRLTQWTRSVLRDREPASAPVRLLMLYALAFLIAQLFPLDLTLDRGELAGKYREGRIAIVPFTSLDGLVVSIAWKATSYTLLCVPIGALAMSGWLRPHQRRSGLAAWAFGLMFIALVEAAQLITVTRHADTTDLFTGALGIAGGVAVSSVVKPDPRVTGSTEVLSS